MLQLREAIKEHLTNQSSKKYFSRFFSSFGQFYRLWVTSHFTARTHIFTFKTHNFIYAYKNAPRFQFGECNHLSLKHITHTHNFNRSTFRKWTRSAGQKIFSFFYRFACMQSASKTTDCVSKFISFKHIFTFKKIYSKLLHQSWVITKCEGKLCQKVVVEN